MASKTYRVTAVLDGGFGALSEVDQTAANGDGWKVAKSSSGFSGEYVAGGTVTANFTSQTTSPKPGVLSTSNAYKTPTVLDGTFDHALSWIFTFSVRATTASSQAGRMRMRVFKGQDPTSTTEITGSTQVGTTSAALSTTADVTTVVTWTPGVDIVCGNEFLYFVLAWEITTASGSNNGDVRIRTGQSAGGSRLVTPNFVTKSLIAEARRQQRLQRNRWY